MSDSLIQHNTTTNQTPTHYAYDKGFDRLVHEFFGNWFNLPMATDRADFKAIEPKIEISETDKEMTITAEVPGIAAKDMEIEISNDGYLTISGEKKSERQENNKGSYFSEISYGSFKRTIPLPLDLQYDTAIADFENGMVRVSIPKTKDTQKKKRKIAINKK